LALASIGVFVLGGVSRVTSGNNDSYNNAVCPLCAERFHVNYHRGDIAQMMRTARCPNCGGDFPEMQLQPEFQKRMNPSGKLPGQQIIENPVP
jgi:hypothetical protein